MIPFSGIDIAVLSCYLLLTAAIGASFYKRSPSAREYFLGGRKVSWLPIGISILAADLSAISVMGIPAWAFQHDLTLLWVTVGYPLVAPLAIFVFAPFYSRLKLYTAYEYLESRFNLGARITTSVLFQLLRAWHVAVAIYGPSLVLHLVTGLPLWKCVLAMGCFTTLYTGLGGMKAVIWTDVLQFTTVLGGILLIIVVAVHETPGGIAGVIHTAQAAGRLRLINTDHNLHEMTTLWACLAGGIFLSLGPLVTDQAILQRLFATRSVRDFQRSVLLQAVFIVPVIALLNLVGIALFAFYAAHPQMLHGMANANDLVPWFVLTQLHRGIAGLVIASIFAASMAVMSAGINALTTATTIDIYARALRPGKSSPHYAAVGRVGTFFWGCFVTCLGLLASRAGDLALAYNRVSSILIGPMLGIFCLGILTKRANSAGAMLGATISACGTTWIATRSDISFFYLGAIGTIIATGGGYLLSLLFPRPPLAKLEGFVWQYGLRNRQISR